MIMRTRYLTIAAVVVALAATMGSCKMYKEYATPTDAPIVSDYAKVKDMPVDSATLGNLGWREVFTDPLLQSYIEQALANNTNLKNAKLNIDIAQARLLGAKLSYFPSLYFSPNRSGSKFGSNDMQWGWQLPFTMSWQTDIYGQITNSKRAAKSALLQSEAYRQAVQSQIIAGVATCYYNLVSLKNQLKIYNENAKLASETVKTMKEMKESARAGFTEVAVVQSEARFQSIIGTIPNIQLGIAQVSNNLSLLMNTTPQEWAVNERSELSMPAKVSNGVPMSYLAQRPDVRASEQAFAQAYYATNLARAAFYPQLSIKASGAYGTLVGSSVIDPAKWLLNLAGSLTAPLFEKGRNIANLKVAKAQQEQALNNFQYSILSASADVSNALANAESYRLQQKNVELQEQALEKAVAYNEDLLALSTTTYLDVITAQQSLLGSQISLESVKLNNNLAVITLYQALGGGR